VAREATDLFSSVVSRAARSFSTRRTAGMCSASSSGSSEFICNTYFFGRKW
jgi:hypothetical protein